MKNVFLVEKNLETTYVQILSQNEKNSIPVVLFCSLKEQNTIYEFPFKIIKSWFSFMSAFSVSD